VTSAVDDVTDGVTSDNAVTDGVRTSLMCRPTVDPATFDPGTCDPDILAAAADSFELLLVDSSAFSLSMLAAIFFTV